MPILPSFRTIISMCRKRSFRTSRPSSRSSTASRCMVTATSRISRRRYRHRCPNGRLFAVTVAINRASRKKHPVNTPLLLWPVDAAIPATFMDTPMQPHGQPIYRHLTRRLSGERSAALVGRFKPGACVGWRERKLTRLEALTLHRPDLGLGSL